MKNKIVKDIFDSIMVAKHPVFICHENPDGDTLGSAFGLRCGLGRNDIDIACESDIPEVFTYLDIADTVKTIKDDYDLYVFLDCSDKQRSRGLSAQLKDNVRTINIDHHKTNSMFGDINFVDINGAATCELVFEILTQNDCTITKACANYIYMGIATDTGLFVHSYTTSKTHLIAAELIDAGADFERISIRTFRKINMKTALLKAKIFNNLEIVDDKIAITYITLGDLASVGASYEMCENLMYELTQIDKITLCIFIKQRQENQCKISLRSSEDVSACDLAKAFNGGGHEKAAGCTIDTDVLEAKKLLLAKVDELKIV